MIICLSKYSLNDNLQRALFKFTPVNIYQRRLEKESKKFGTWLDAIGLNHRQEQKSHTTLYICDLHFDESCLENNTVKVFLDKTHVTLSRKRLRLKKNSVSSVFELSASIHCPNSTCNATAASNLSPLLHREPLMSLVNSSTKSALVPPSSSHSALRPEPTASLDNDSTSKSCTYETCNGEYLQQTTESNDFTVSNLLQQWNSKIGNDDIGPWAVFPSQSGLLFMLVEGEGTVPITRIVFMKDDMTVQLLARSREAKFPVFEDKVSCLQDFLTALKCIRKLGMCMRSDDGSYCKNGFFIRKCVTRSNRCKNCQIARRRKKDWESKVAKRAKTNASKKKILKKTIKQKYKRCERKIRIR